MNRLTSYLFPSTRWHGTAFFLLFLTVMGLPLLVYPWMLDSFILGKEVFFRVMVALVLGAVLGTACFGERIRFLIQPVNGFVLAYVAWTTLSIFWADAPVLAREEAARTAVLVLFFLLLQSLTANNRRSLLTLAAGLCLSTLVAAVYTLVQDFRGAFAPGSLSVRSFLGDWRDYLLPVLLGNTSHLGDFLAIGVLLWGAVFIVSRATWMKALSVVSLWLHAAALIVAWSVHSNVSLMVAALVAVFMLRFHFERKDLVRLRRRAVVLVSGWVAVVLFFVVDQPLNPHGSAVWSNRTEAAYRQSKLEIPAGGFHGGIFSEAFASPRWTSGFDTRLAIWLQTLEIIRQNPWLGAGAGNFTWAYPAAISGIVENDPSLAKYSGAWTNAAHNDLLQTWSELGIIGAFLLIVIVGAAAKMYWDRLRSGTSFGNAIVLATGFAILIAQVLQAQMNFPLQLPVSSMIFFCVLAVPMVLPRAGAEDEEFNVPVERPFGSLRIGVMMRNMAFPSELHLRIQTKPRSGMLLLIVPFLAIGWWCWDSIKPLRADMVYRSVYELKQMPGFEGTVIERARQTLAIWPDDADARSTLQDALLKSGDFEGVVEQTPYVLRKLNATEVYLRRAIALEKLGRTGEANADWDIVFGRQPLQYGGAYPAQFGEYLARHPEVSGDS